VQGITENDIAQYLANTPAFFERHAELLGSVQLTSPHGHRAVSLQERQMEMLRDRIKGLEMKIVEMIRHGQENVGLADRLHRFTRGMLTTAAPAELPVRMVASLQHEFMIPQAAIRLWGVEEAHSGQPWAADVSADVKSFASSLTLPYCGVNAGFEAAQWLQEPGTVLSLAMIPLRGVVQGGAGANEGAFGLLVLGSPDATRYAADMGTEFLMRIGELSGAALSRLRAA
jgi:uncharacterized protein YigA (DUF484 family)